MAERLAVGADRGGLDRGEGGDGVVGSTATAAAAGMTGWGSGSTRGTDTVSSTIGSDVETTAFGSCGTLGEATVMDGSPSSRRKAPANTVPSRRSVAGSVASPATSTTARPAARATVCSTQVRSRRRRASAATAGRSPRRRRRTPSPAAHLPTSGTRTARRRSRWRRWPTPAPASRRRAHSLRMHRPAPCRPTWRTAARGRGG